MVSSKRPKKKKTRSSTPSACLGNNGLYTDHVMIMCVSGDVLKTGWKLHETLNMEGWTKIHLQESLDNTEYLFVNVIFRSKCIKISRHEILLIKSLLIAEISTMFQQNEKEETLTTCVWVEMVRTKNIAVRMLIFKFSNRMKLYTALWQVNCLPLSGLLFALARLQNL